MTNLDWAPAELAFGQLAWDYGSPEEPHQVVCEQLVGEGAYMQDGTPLLDVFAEMRLRMHELAGRYRLTVDREVHQRAFLVHEPYEAMRARLDEAGIEVVLPHPGFEAIAFSREGVKGKAEVRIMVRR